MPNQRVGKAVALEILRILEEETDGLYMLDILRGGIQNDDPRIPRNVSK